MTKRRAQTIDAAGITKGQLSERAEKYVTEAVKNNASRIAGARAIGAAPGDDHMIKSPRVREAMSAEAGLALEVGGVTAADVVRGYRQIAFRDVRGMYEDDGTVVPLKQLPDDLAASIESIEVVEEYIEGAGRLIRVKKYHFARKLGALDSLARYLGLMTDQPKAEEALTELLAYIGQASRPLIGSSK